MGIPSISLEVDTLAGKIYYEVRDGRKLLRRFDARKSKEKAHKKAVDFKEKYIQKHGIISM